MSIAAPAPTSQAKGCLPCCRNVGWVNDSPPNQAASRRILYAAASELTNLPVHISGLMPILSVYQGAASEVKSGGEGQRESSRLIYLLTLTIALFINAALPAGF